MFLNMWLATAALTASSRAGPALMRAASTVAAPVLTQTGVNTELKMKILISAAALDRGQSYNPT